jgi:membrane associated rhomboid family serine protease
MALFRSILNDIESSFSTGSMVKKLLLTNFIVFICVQLLFLGCNVIYGSQAGEFKVMDLLEYISMSSDWREVLWRPWTLITACFVHFEIWHLIGNIFWLYLFGNIVGDLIGDRRILPIYLLGGIAGCVMFFISAQISPLIGSMAYGASAAVMALGGCALILNPEYRVGLFFLGEVKLKYIVLVMVLLDLVGASRYMNAGGHAAHIGGFIFGISYVYALRDGNDWAAPVNRLLDWFMRLFDRSASNRSRMKVSHHKPSTPPPAATQRPDESAHEARLNAILDKIKQQGYENLTAEEKEFLYQASKR